MLAKMVCVANISITDSCYFLPLFLSLYSLAYPNLLGTKRLGCC
jgi:hypothetical protein